MFGTGELSGPRRHPFFPLTFTLAPEDPRGWDWFWAQGQGAKSKVTAAGQALASRLQQGSCSNLRRMGPKDPAPLTQPITTGITTSVTTTPTTRTNTNGSSASTSTTIPMLYNESASLVSASTTQPPHGMVTPVGGTSAVPVADNSKLEAAIPGQVISRRSDGDDVSSTSSVAGSSSSNAGIVMDSDVNEGQVKRVDKECVAVSIVYGDEEGAEVNASTAAPNPPSSSGSSNDGVAEVDGGRWMVPGDDVRGEKARVEKLWTALQEQKRVMSTGVEAAAPAVTAAAPAGPATIIAPAVLLQGVRRVFLTSSGAPRAGDQIGGNGKNQHVAVSGLWLAVDRGETFGLLGPNGAGKTTCLRMMQGA